MILPFDSVDNEAVRGFRPNPTLDRVGGGIGEHSTLRVFIDCGSVGVRCLQFGVVEEDLERFRSEDRLIAAMRAQPSIWVQLLKEDMETKKLQLIRLREYVCCPARF